jgi:hypothetical protein
MPSAREILAELLDDVEGHSNADIVQHHVELALKALDAEETTVQPSDLLDLPQLAISVLRRHMIDRAHRGQPVAWYSDGHRHTAESRPDKREGAWLVHGNQWEGYRNLRYVLVEIDRADTFELVEP